MKLIDGMSVERACIFKKNKLICVHFIFLYSSITFERPFCLRYRKVAAGDNPFCPVRYAYAIK